MNNIPAPSWLSKLAKEYYGKIKKVIVITQHNAHLAFILCDQLATYRNISEQLDKDGLTVVSGQGCPKAHPLLVAQKNCWGTIQQAWRLLNKGGEDQIEVETIV